MIACRSGSQLSLLLQCLMECQIIFINHFLKCLTDFKDTKLLYVSRGQHLVYSQPKIITNLSIFKRIVLLVRRRKCLEKLFVQHVSVCMIYSIINHPIAPADQFPSLFIMLPVTSNHQLCWEEIPPPQRCKNIISPICRIGM